jgi:CBS domain-containing protein
MRCEQVMKRLVHRARSTDSLRAAAQKMREHDVGFLPVCDEEDHVIGVVTDRDIVVRACADDKAMTATRVEAVMSPDVIACRPTHGLRHAEALMIENRKSRMVITDADGKLLGVISMSDLAQYETPAHMAETLAGISARKYVRG